MDGINARGKPNWTSSNRLLPRIHVFLPHCVSLKSESLTWILCLPIYKKARLRREKGRLSEIQWTLFVETVMISLPGIHGTLNSYPETSHKKLQRLGIWLTFKRALPSNLVGSLPESVSYFTACFRTMCCLLQPCAARTLLQKQRRRAGAELWDAILGITQGCKINYSLQRGTKLLDSVMPGLLLVAFPWSRLLFNTRHIPFTPDPGPQ